MQARYVIIGLLVFVSMTILGTFRRTHAEDSDAPIVTYSNGGLHVKIPYTAPRAGEGTLTIEVLNPEDQSVARLEHRTTLAKGKGWWKQDLKLSKPMDTEELVWHRLRYRFVYAGDPHAAVEGVDSISQILQRPLIHVMAQQAYLSGAAAAVRVIATDVNSEPIEGASTLRIELVKPDAPNAPGQALFRGPLNQRGTTEAQLLLPAGLVGGYSLRYVVDTPIGSTDFVQPVRLEDKVSILLTTEKPIYQPGQTIHVRALALDRANHRAAGARKLTFEVEDSRGNKVFKRATQTDGYGVASAEFGLADEVNLGTYHLRALMDGEGAGRAGNRAEIALGVERYVLPKFKVAVDFAGQDQKARHGYRPGDHVTGTVRANYFFGKAVDHAEVTVKASGMDVEVVEVAAAQGKTDDDGAYRFHLKLPTYFAGRPLSQGAARVLIEATVKDAAGHAETRGEPITVSESPLLITAVPEGGTLIPGIENQVFVLASYADGTPAKAELRVQAAGNPDQTVRTDESGVAVVPIAAASAPHALDVDAKDAEGNRTSRSVPLELRQGAEQILLRTERAVYHAGDRIQLRVFSTRKQGAMYLDAVKDGQTVLTRDVEMTNGQAELDLTATPDLAGTVDFNAYLFGRDARPVADHRLVFVQPASELKIEATADRAEYKPGDDARIEFHVTNERGEGVQAALGLQVVDEAVFALAEKQPGFAKVFFYLEQEALKPRYEIHSLSMPEVVNAVHPAGVGAAPRPNQAARALFAATEMVNANRYDREFGRIVPQDRWPEYGVRYRTRFSAQVERIADRFNQADRQHAERDLGKLTERLAASGAAELRDAWDTPVRFNPAGAMLVVRSAGPDKQFNTGDDLATYLMVSTRPVVRSINATGNSIDLRVEHGVGPFNGMAQIAGGVQDQSGAAVPDTGITVRPIGNGAIRAMHSNGAGQFQFSGLPPGEYDVRISMAGFQTTSRRFLLAERDRAVLAVTLNVGERAETVMVTAQAGMLAMGGGFGGGGGGRIRVGGHAPVGMGGVLGGVLGGVPMAAPPRPQMAAARLKDTNGAFSIDGAVAMYSMVATGSLAGGVAPAPRVRSYFPEALYINPEIITGGNGRATISIPLADSITTWRMAMMASTVNGALGSGSSSLKVFQDFFTDLDLPVTLTQGDRVSIPVAVYNYTGSRGDVSLKLTQEDWFALVQDSAEKNVMVDAGRVGSSQFTIQANRIGKFKLTLAAKMGGVPFGPGGRADIVVREIEVIPNGREQTEVFNGRLETAVAHTLPFPPAAIPDASSVVVRLYPGPLSQVIEGMDAILRMPFGCFEQTSSATYPNVLALDYMKRTGKLTPEVHAKAEGFIANGYQRLLTFEVPGGGFSWFGQAPANKILTAYGLMEFSDMAKVSEVDPSLIQRTQRWLAAQQQADGSWKPDTNFINEGATNRYNSDVLRISAYIAWSLESTGYQGPAVEKARQFVGQHMGDHTDAYTLAVLANFAADYAKDREFTNRAMQNLLDARTEKGEQVSWTVEETGMYGAGESAAVETTGLAVQALLKWGQASGMAGKALAYLASKKNA
ncbi:MAG TPA: MG2 domain-containing protein, partial [Bryobacteraceae bacterium]|nr:MG2 domain-containing protein [Bryobacteraceae bacterium]